MSSVLWMKSTCTTCRSAKAKLEQLGVQFEVRDYARRPLAAAELEGLLPADPGPMVSTKSPKFKELGLQDRHLSKPEAIALMVADNNLLRRPILVHSGGVVIGFGAAVSDAYAALATR